MANTNTNYLTAVSIATDMNPVPEYVGKHVGRIVKFVFCQQLAWVSDTATGQGTLLQLSDPTEWGDTLSASDATKSVVLPYMRSPAKITAGEGKFADKFGYRIYPGYKSPSMVEFELNAPPDTTLAALEEIKAYEGLHVMFINEMDQIICGNTSSGGTVPQFISCIPNSFYVSDPTVDPDTGEYIVTGSFQLKPGWAAGGFMTITTATVGSFLTDLINS